MKKCPIKWWVWAWSFQIQTCCQLIHFEEDRVCDPHLWQMILSLAAKAKCKTSLIFQNTNFKITGPAAPYNDYVSLRGKVDSVVCFGAWATFCNIMYNCLIQNFRYSKVNLLKNLTFFLRDLEIVGIMLLLRTVISLMKDKVKNVFCLRFEKRLRNIGSIPR